MTTSETTPTHTEQAIRYLVPDAVAEAIVSTGLYRDVAGEVSR